MPLDGGLTPLDTGLTPLGPAGGLTPIDAGLTPLDGPGLGGGLGLGGDMLTAMPPADAFSGASSGFGSSGFGGAPRRKKRPRVGIGLHTPLDMYDIFVGNGTSVILGTVLSYVQLFGVALLLTLLAALAVKLLRSAAPDMTREQRGWAVYVLVMLGMTLFLLAKGWWETGLSRYFLRVARRNKGDLLDLFRIDEWSGRAILLSVLTDGVLFYMLLQAPIFAWLEIPSVYVTAVRFCAFAYIPLLYLMYLAIPRIVTAEEEVIVSAGFSARAMLSNAAMILVLFVLFFIFYFAPLGYVNLRLGVREMQTRFGEIQFDRPSSVFFFHGRDMLISFANYCLTVPVAYLLKACIYLGVTDERPGQGESKE